MLSIKQRRKGQHDTYIELSSSAGLFATRSDFHPDAASLTGEFVWSGSTLFVGRSHFSFVQPNSNKEEDAT